MKHSAIRAQVPSASSASRVIRSLWDESVGSPLRETIHADVSEATEGDAPRSLAETNEG
jgi:hypothetical protein